MPLRGDQEPEGGDKEVAGKHVVLEEAVRAGGTGKVRDACCGGVPNADCHGRYSGTTSTSTTSSDASGGEADIADGESAEGKDKITHKEREVDAGWNQGSGWRSGSGGEGGGGARSMAGEVGRPTAGSEWLVVSELERDVELLGRLGPEPEGRNQAGGPGGDREQRWNFRSWPTTTPLLLLGIGWRWWLRRCRTCLKEPRNGGLAPWKKRRGSMKCG